MCTERVIEYWHQQRFYLLCATPTQPSHPLPIMFIVLFLLWFDWFVDWPLCCSYFGLTWFVDWPLCCSYFGLTWFVDWPLSCVTVLKVRELSAMLWHCDRWFSNLPTLVKPHQAELWEVFLGRHQPFNTRLSSWLDQSSWYVQGHGRCDHSVDRLPATT